MKNIIQDLFWCLGELRLICVLPFTFLLIKTAVRINENKVGKITTHGLVNSSVVTGYVDAAVASVFAGERVVPQNRMEGTFHKQKEPLIKFLLDGS